MMDLSEEALRGLHAALEREAHEALATAFPVEAARLPRFALVLDGSMSELGVFRCGAGQPSGGTIALSLRLVTEHPWYAAVDVLRHELAHYAVWALYPEVSEPPHGERFRRCCAALGGNPRASGSYPPLDVSLLLDDGSYEATRSPLELRIQKLLALSGSPNEHEAAQALLKARELMARLGIEEVRLEEDADPLVRGGVTVAGSRLPADERAMASFLTAHFGVLCVVREEVRVVSGCLERGAGYDVCGRRSKVKVALYVRDYLWRVVEARAVDGAGRPLPVTRRRHFALGMLSALSRRLSGQALPVAATSAERALVKAEEAAQRRFVSALYPRLRRLGGRRLQVGREDYGAGERVGDELDIAPGIGDGRREAPRQLT